MKALIATLVAVPGLLLAPAALAQMKVAESSRAFTLPGGKVIHTSLYLPADGSVRPGVLVIPTYYAQLNNSSEPADEAYAEKLAEQGYAVMVPLLTQYGKRAYDGSHGRDLAALTEQFRALPEVADEASASVGFSVGASMAALGAAADPKTRAVIGYYGPYDLFEVGFAVPGMDRANGAINSSERIRAAVLLLVGEEDTETPPPQTAAFARRLGDAGRKVELVQYPGAHHRFDRGPPVEMRGERTTDGFTYRLDVAARDDAWKRTLAWLNQHLPR